MNREYTRNVDTLELFPIFPNKYNHTQFSPPLFIVLVLNHISNIFIVKHFMIGKIYKKNRYFSFICCTVMN